MVIRIISILNDMMSESPIWINTKAAKREGLKTGDEVMLKNEFGEAKGKIFVTEGIREDTLFVYHGFGHDTPQMSRANSKGINDSILLNPADGKICGTMVTNVGVDIIKL